MKHKLLLPLAVMCGINATAQNKPSGKTNHFASQSPAVVLSKLKKENAPAKQTTQLKTIPNSPLASNVLAPTWTPFAKSMNVYGVLIDGQKPLQYNPYVKAVSFIHRKSASYTAAPADNSGAMVAEISTNWGSTWDSTCIYSDATYPGRYPQGGIYSAPGNTVLSNAYVVGTGIALDGGSSWVGAWAASKQLGAGNYNTGASATPNAQQLLSNFVPYSPAGKTDYAAYSFASTNDGKVHSIGYVCNDINASDPGLRGYRVLTGTFNAGVFDWSGDSVIATTELRTDGSKHMSYTPIMAWSENGQIGYVITLGVAAGATGSNRGYQPIISKTTNGGTSWSVLSGIDFSAPSYSTILNRLEPIPNSTVVVPQFNTSEGVDATVDANGKLHIAATLNSTASNDIDSLDYNQTYVTGEDYSFEHTPGKMPYLYDFYGDGSAAWSYKTIDSLTSEGPSDISGGPGYLDNPWDEDAGQKVHSGSRIQLSRTPDGKFIVFTWAESNPAFTIGGKNWNNIPEIKTRMIDVTNIGGLGAYATSVSKYNLTPVGTPVNSKAMFHFAAPVISAQTYTSSNTVTFTVPVTVTNSNPYSQLTENTHWFAAAKLDFVLNSVGINENSANEASNLSLYPNPAKDNTTLTIDLKENTQVSVVIYDVVGKQMKHIAANGNVGSNAITLDMNGFAKGIYFVNVKAGNSSSTKKVVVE